ncbi:hypothetical protein [Natronorubrum bangense]|nr:hypothetical protein [Natronorubrum bangense]
MVTFTDLMWLLAVVGVVCAAMVGIALLTKRWIMIEASVKGIRWLSVTVVAVGLLDEGYGADSLETNAIVVGVAVVVVIASEAGMLWVENNKP